MRGEHENIAKACSMIPLICSAEGKMISESSMRLVASAEMP